MTAGTALQRVDQETGEVLTVETFDFPRYLTHLTSAKALQEQQQLAAVYDAACRALIGPNDVQQEGKREFKKKSAWRKLQRHFGISTAVQKIERGFQERGDETPVFVAVVTVRATAPWGQSSEAVGACGTDEEVKRRKITIADAIATAETRATNRAVSNLIAMGEVSAEELGGRPQEPITITPETPLTFGKSKGTPLNQLPDKYLAWMIGEGRTFGSPAETEAWQEAARLELDSRRANDSTEEDFSDVPEAVREEIAEVNRTAGKGEA